MPAVDAGEHTRPRIENAEEHRCEHAGTAVRRRDVVVGVDDGAGHNLGIRAPPLHRVTQRLRTLQRAKQCHVEDGAHALVAHVGDDYGEVAFGDDKRIVEITGNAARGRILCVARWYTRRATSAPAAHVVSPPPYVRYRVAAVRRSCADAFGAILTLQAQPSAR